LIWLPETFLLAQEKIPLKRIFLSQDFFFLMQEQNLLTTRGFVVLIFPILRALLENRKEIYFRMFILTSLLTISER